MGGRPPGPSRPGRRLRQPGRIARTPWSTPGVEDRHIGHARRRAIHDHGPEPVKAPAVAEVEQGVIRRAGIHPPIVQAGAGRMLVDGPTIGGYLVLGVVPAADLPRPGQLRPGDEVRTAPGDESVAGSLRSGRDERVRAGRPYPVATTSGSGAAASSATW